MVVKQKQQFRGYDMVQKEGPEWVKVPWEKRQHKGRLQGNGSWQVLTDEGEAQPPKRTPHSRGKLPIRNANVPIRRFPQPLSNDAEVHGTGGGRTHFWVDAGSHWESIHARNEEKRILVGGQNIFDNNQHRDKPPTLEFWEDVRERWEGLLIQPPRIHTKRRPQGKYLTQELAKAREIINLSSRAQPRRRNIRIHRPKKLRTTLEVREDTSGNLEMVLRD